MKLKEWLVLLDVQIDSSHLVKLKYSIPALTSEIALVNAGIRLRRKFKDAIVVNASIRPNK